MTTLKAKINELSFRQLNWIFFSFLGLALIWIFRKYIFFQDFFIFEDIGSDTMTLFYPGMLENARVVREEGLPLWSFHKGIGQNNYSVDLLTPFFWMLVAFGTKYVAYGIAWVQFIKLALVPVCSYYFFKLQNFDQRAVLLGTALMSFLGYLIVGSSWYGHSENILFMMLFLLGIEMLLVKNKWWLIPIPLVFLFGPSLFFLAEFTLIYLILRLSLAGKLTFKSIGRLLQKLIVPAIFTLVLAAPFLGSTIYKFIYSPRVGGDSSYTNFFSSIRKFQLESAEHNLSALYRTFSNDLIGTGDEYFGWNNYLEAPLFYCGLISLLLVPQVFRYLNKYQRIFFSGAILLWVFIVLFPYFRFAFYLFVGNYYKGALSLFIPLTLLWMAVVSFNYILKSKKINITVLGLSLLILLALLYFPFSGLPQSPLANIRVVITVFLVLETIFLVLWHFGFLKAYLPALIIATVIIEGALLSNFSMNDRLALKADRFNKRELHNDFTKEALAYIASIDKPFYRVEKTYGSVKAGYNDSQSQGFFGTRSYRSHNHNNYIEFLGNLGLVDPNDEITTRWVVGLQKVPQLHGLFSIKYLLANQATRSEVSKAYYEDLGQMNGLNIYRNKYFIPFGIPMSKIMAKSEFDQLPGFYEKTEALYSAIVLEDQDLQNYPDLNRFNRQDVVGALSIEKWRDEYTPMAMEISSFKQSQIKGRVSPNEASIILFTFPFDEGWRAWVDGERSELIKVDNGLTGLYVKAGVHDIQLKYRPPYFGLGWLVFGLGLLVYLYLVFIHNKPKNDPIIEHTDYDIIQSKSSIESNKKVKLETVQVHATKKKTTNKKVKKRKKRK